MTPQPPSNRSGDAPPPGNWQPPAIEEMQQMLSQYRFLSLLGRGGMGAVYKAVQTSLEREVAIKVLPTALLSSSDTSFTERFKNEARTMARMNHPAIVNVYDFGETQSGLLYIVMEFVDGTDVSRMIGFQGRLPADHALAITAHVCDALEYAHTHGVIHRDIKPANVLINMEGAVKVADFGLAKASGSTQAGLTQPDMAMGTPDFVAPEALFAGIPLDGRADIYAVGVMLYQMLTGNIPRGMWQMPSALAQTDPRFDMIIARAMQMDREARHQSALELRRELDIILTVPYIKPGDAHSSAAIPKAQLVIPQKRQPMVIHQHPQRPGVGNPGKPVRQPPRQIVTYRPERRSALPAFIVGVLLAAGAYFAWQKFRDRSPLAEGASSIVAATSSQPNTGDTATTPASSADQSSTRPAPADALAFGGHRYKFVLGDVTWDEAEARSEGMGGHLATLTTPEEDEWVRKTFADPLPPERLLYIGAHKAAESNTWQWVTGEAWAFENWRKSSKPADSPERLGGTYHRYVDAAQWAAGWNPARKIAIPSGPEQGLPRTMGYLVEWDHDLTYAPVSARDKATLTFGGHRYLWVAAKGITLSEAKESAHNAGGYLVTITSAAENDFVMALTTKFNGQTWTGGLRATRGRNGWIWMNGEAFSFPGPPTEWQSSTAPGDAITVMSGTWNDYESPTRSPNIAGFIVEWGAPRTPPPADALVFGSNRYKVLPDKSLTWTQANAAAEAMGGHLATITTKEENDWISASFIAKVERGLGLWIGGTSQGTPGKWRWVTGEPFDFTSWIPGEPSNNSFEPAITFTNNDAGVIGWGDIKDDGFGKRDRRAGFIAEWEADTAPGPSAASSIDLLAGVDVKRDALVGQWEVTPDGLVTTMQNGGKSQVLEFDHSTPEEYNFEIEFTVTAGTREVVQVLPLPTHSIIWKMGPERKDPAPYGFGPILDGANITSGTRTEAMTHLPRLKIGQRYRCLLEVRKGSLRAVLDGAEIVKWSGDLMRLNWEPIWQLRNPRHLGIAAYTSSVIFHKAELSPVVVESPRLAELKAQFDNAFERDVTKVYRTALSDLDSKYLAAVDRALADATKIGRLEEAVALQEEKQRLADRQPLPAADPVNVTAGLKKLRDTYRSELTKLVRQRDAAANVVYTRYDQSLAALQTDFTQKNLLPDALAVKRRREALDKLRQPAAAPAMMVAAAGTSPTLSASMSLAAAPAQQKASPPKPPAQLVPDILKETPPKPFTQEEAIHWALSLNGSAKILKGKTEMDVLNLGSLPRGKYTLIGLKVGENQLIHVVSLAGLSELADLSELNLSNNFLTDDGLAFLPPLPKLTSLSLTNCRLSDASFEHLAKQPSLTHLRIGNNNITGVGLTSYPRASSLTSLTIGSGNLNDEGIAAITRCTALESLDVTCSKLTCTNFAPLAAVGTLRRFTISTAATDVLVQSLSPLTHLEVLDMSNSAISDFALDRIASMTALHEIRFDGCKGLTDSGFLKLLPLGRNVVRIGVAGTRLSDTGLRELSTELTELTEIDLSFTGVSPAGLASLANLRRLSALGVHARHCTDEGLRHLARVTSGATLKNFGIVDQHTLSRERMNAVRAALSRWSF